MEYVALGLGDMIAPAMYNDDAKEKEVKKRMHVGVGALKKGVKRNVRRRRGVNKETVERLETRIRGFVTSLSSSSSDTSGLDAEEDMWVVLDPESSSSSASDMGWDPEDGVGIPDAVLLTARTHTSYTSTLQDRRVMIWDVPDSNLRYVIHALCGYYGLLSQSRDTPNGRCVFLEHPRYGGEEKVVGGMMKKETGVPKVLFADYVFS